MIVASSVMVEGTSTLQFDLPTFKFLNQIERVLYGRDRRDVMTQAEWVCSVCSMQVARVWTVPIESQVSL